MAKDLKTELVKASEKIADGDWKSYRIALNRWDSNGSGGLFMAVEKYEARPSPFNEGGKAWLRKQQLTVNSKETLDRLIAEMQKIGQELESNQAKQPS